MRLTACYSCIRVANEPENPWVIHCHWKQPWIHSNRAVPIYKCKLTGDEVELIRETVGWQASRLTGGTLNNPGDFLNIGHLNRIFIYLPMNSSGGLLRLDLHDKNYAPPEFIDLQPFAPQIHKEQDWRPDESIPEDFYS
jgi:hypothetical protein